MPSLQEDAKGDEVEPEAAEEAENTELAAQEDEEAVEAPRKHRKPEVNLSRRPEAWQRPPPRSPGIAAPPVKRRTKNEPRLAPSCHGRR